MSKIEKCDIINLTYQCDNDDISQYYLIIIHKFLKIDTYIDSLSYYISVNGDKVFYNESDIIAIYKPKLLSTDVNNDDKSYTSVYSIPSLVKLIRDPLDKIKLNLLLPFDHKFSIISLELFKFWTNIPPQKDSFLILNERNRI